MTTDNTVQESTTQTNPVVPEGFSIVKITHDKKSGHDFMRSKDIERTKSIYLKSGIELEEIHKEGEEYDPQLVGEKDPEQLKRIGSVRIKSLTATSGCATCH